MSRKSELIDKIITTLDLAMDRLQTLIKTPESSDEIKEVALIVATVNKAINTLQKSYLVDDFEEEVQQKMAAQEQKRELTQVDLLCMSDVLREYGFRVRIIYTDRFLELPGNYTAEDIPYNIPDEAYYEH